MPHRRTVYFVSDRTGITAEMLGNSLLTQFEDFEFRRVTIPFVDSDERVADAIRQVNETVDPEGRRPIVISSVVDEAMSARIRPRDDLALMEGYHSPQVDVPVRLNTNESPFPPPAAFTEAVSLMVPPPRPEAAVRVFVELDDRALHDRMIS